MHELSLALEVIELARREAAVNRISVISGIVIEVGDLSGVEADAFQSALELVLTGTILDGAVIQMNRTPGRGTCNACSLEFEMNSPVETCPQCQCFPSEISGGKEFRVVSLSGD